jgi:hypothetical protein
MALPVFAFGTVSPTNAIESDAAEEGGGREEQGTGQQQPPAADEISEPSDADDHGGDGQEIGEHDPLDLLEGGAERLRQRRQRDVGDACAE